MTILFLSLPITPLLSSAAFAFTWVTRNGQFDDLKMPALRFLELDQV